MKANEWISSIAPLMQGRGGGKPESAQASGPNFTCLEKALETAKAYAYTTLKLENLKIEGNA